MVTLRGRMLHQIVLPPSSLTRNPVQIIYPCCLMLPCESLYRFDYRNTIYNIFYSILLEFSCKMSHLLSWAERNIETTLLSTISLEKIELHCTFSLEKPWFEPFYVDVRGVQEVMVCRKPSAALGFMAHQVFMKNWHKVLKYCNQK